jgi:hypothetical protein
MDVEQILNSAALRLQTDFHHNIGRKKPWVNGDQTNAGARLIYMQLRSMEHDGFCEINREEQSKNSFYRILSVTVSKHHRGVFDANAPFPSLDSLDSQISAGKKHLKSFRDLVADVWASCGFVEHVNDNGDVVFEIPQSESIAQLDAFNKIEEVAISVADMRPLDTIPSMEDDIVPNWYDDILNTNDHPEPT